MLVYKCCHISAAHQLSLPYESPCNRPHGHNYKIEIWVHGDVDENGILVDFQTLQYTVHLYDHRNLNDLFSPTTAEAFAYRLVRDILNRCNKVQEVQDRIKSIKVRVWETETCYAQESWHK